MSTRINQETGLLGVKSVSSAGGNVRLNQEVLLLLTPPIITFATVSVTGRFVDCLGNPVANGYVTLRLSEDVCVTGSSLHLTAGSTSKVPLDANGTMLTTQLWANSLMSPSGSYYTINVFTHTGAQAFPTSRTFTLPATPNTNDIANLIT